jgi:2-polyprenyl-6-methoxyphenol hydroxylase-like FAD-dependent oxidoreductase
LIERAPGLRTGGYVIDFWGLGYDIAERMALIAEINCAGYHVKELRIVGETCRRRAGFGTRVFSELTGGRFVTLPRSDLSRLLFERVELREETDGVWVRFKHAGERRFDLVIGADGLHSIVRELVFGRTAPLEKHLGYAIAAFEIRGNRPRDEDVYLLYGQPGRMIGRFTLHDDCTLILFVFAVADMALPVTLDQQKALLQKVYADGG